MFRPAVRLLMPLAFLGPLCCGLGAPASSAPLGTPLTDGTRVDRWTLANGLRVVVRQVPGARTSAATLCYRLGTFDDPDGQEGLAELVAQAAFTARAGDVPRRHLGEMDQVRPGGWNFKITPYVTEFTEAAPRDLFPGVLHQVCQRLRGISAADDLLEETKTEVRDRFKQNLDANVEGALATLSEQLASRHGPERAMRYATGKGLDAIPAAKVRSLIAERVVPANTVLCVVGDFEGINLRALLDKEVGDVPAGKAQPPIAWGRLTSAQGVVDRNDIDGPVAVLGVLAPALTDTNHACFTVFALSVGGMANTKWGKPTPPLAHRFQFSLAADPELVRFYPPLDSETPEPGQALLLLLHESGPKIVDSLALAGACERAVWLAGGPMPADLAQRAPGDPTVTNSLSTLLAALEQYGDEAFWARYRKRALETPALDQRPLFEFFASPKNHVALTVKPGH